jgi:hypothetical protein
MVLQGFSDSVLSWVSFPWHSAMVYRSCRALDLFIGPMVLVVTGVALTSYQGYLPFDGGRTKITVPDIL